MSEFKVSFNLLKQQIDELQKVSTQMLSLSEKVSLAADNLGQDELLTSARASLKTSASNIGAKAELFGIASATLSEIIEQYTGTEKKNISKAEGTKAHARDFYKNPVVISDGAGDVVSGTTAAYTAGSKAGYEAATAGATVGAASAVAGAEVGASAAVAGTEAGAAAAVSGAQAATAAATAGAAQGAGTAFGGVALGAGVAVAGAAVGAAGIVGGTKLVNMAKEKKQAAEQQQAQQIQTPPQAVQQQTSITENEAGIKRAEDQLQRAREALDSMQ